MDILILFIYQVSIVPLLKNMGFCPLTRGRFFHRFFVLQELKFIVASACDILETHTLLLLAAKIRFVSWRWSPYQFFAFFEGWFYPGFGWRFRVILWKSLPFNWYFLLILSHLLYLEWPDNRLMNVGNWLAYIFSVDSSELLATEKEWIGHFNTIIFSYYFGWFLQINGWHCRYEVLDILYHRFTSSLILWFLNVLVHWKNILGKSKLWRNFFQEPIILLDNSWIGFYWGRLLLLGRWIKEISVKYFVFLYHIQAINLRCLNQKMIRGL